MKEIIIKQKNNKRVAVYRLNDGTSRFCTLNEMTVGDIVDITGATSIMFNREIPPIEANVWYVK